MSTAFYSSVCITSYATLTQLCISSKQYKSIISSSHLFTSLFVLYKNSMSVGALNISWISGRSKCCLSTQLWTYLENNMCCRTTNQAENSKNINKCPRNLEDLGIINLRFAFPQNFQLYAHNGDSSVKIHKILSSAQHTSE